MNSYTYEEALDASMKYFNNEELPAKVFVDKYALRDQDGNILEKSPDQMHRRVAREIARIEKNKFKQPMSEDEIYEYLKDFKNIIPQGSILFGIGNKYQYATLSNCYVLEKPQDSYGSILKTDEQIVQISKRRGGIGIDISNLRPSGFPTANSSRTSTGIVPFMERYSNSIREVGQGNRRGAGMITISVHHPQILDFINVKRDAKKVTGANISIRLTDEFLNAVKNNEDYEQRFPVDSKKPQFKQMVSAKMVWDAIIDAAWAMAEPGLLFWDNIINESPADCYANDGFETLSTNPCSEIPLSTLDSCRLILQNLFGCVTDSFTSNARFDFDKLYKNAMVMQRFIDDIIDLEIECIDRIIDKIEKDPEPTEIKDREISVWERVKIACIKGRRTGCGITGLADAMAAVGIKYGTPESVKFVDDIYRTLKLGCYRSSVDMAKELGAFPIFDWDKEKSNPFLKRLYEADKDLKSDMKQYGRRNIACLTTAPAGTVSLLAKLTNRFGTSSGLEPVFMASYVRKRKITHDDTRSNVDSVDQNGDKWSHFKVYHGGLEEWMKATDGNELGSPYYGACASDLDWKFRVELQAVAQSHIDHAISSTINLPNDVSKAKVAEIYETAWKLGCKGMTVYRDGCRTGVLVKEDKKDTAALKRPEDLPCEVHHIKVRKNSESTDWYVLVGLMNDKPYEVFVGANNGCISSAVKTGLIKKMKRGWYHAYFDDKSEFANISNHCSDEEEAVGRLVSTSLRHGADISFIVHQLEKVKSSDLYCFSKALARALKKYIPDGTKVKGEDCPECQSHLIRENGCVRCSKCSWTKCG